MTYILGLTGGIATGKSAVSQAFKDYGFPIVDADVGARAVVEAGTPGLQAVADYFGPVVLLEDGSLNRKALGAIVFADSQKRSKLNELLKPYIRTWIEEQTNKAIQQRASLVVLDIPLLYEANYQTMMNEVMVVALPEQLQLERLMKRDNSSQAEALQRIKAQMPIAEKVALADTIIDNGGSLAETQEQIKKWLKKNNFLTSTAP